MQSLTFQQLLPAAGAALRTVILFVAVLTIPLTAAQALGMSEDQASSWILALYGLPSLISLLFSWYYKQPILFTGNIFMIVLIAQLADDFTYAELIGAAIGAGIVVLLLTLFGLTTKITTLIPMPIVFGLLAGVVTPFLVNMFNLLGQEPYLLGSTLLAYLASRYFLSQRLPAIVPAIVFGIVVAAIEGQLGSVDSTAAIATPVFTTPTFTVAALLSVMPVFVILITLQANLPSLRFLESQQYQVPQQVINSTSGLGTTVGSLFGPTGVSLSLPATSLVASAEAGEHHQRHYAVYMAAGASLLIGLLAGIAAELSVVLPTTLLLALVGLAVVDIELHALHKITEGPLLLGPLFAFAVALSDMELLGFGHYFWSLVLGTIIARWLEADQLRNLHEQDTSKKSLSGSGESFPA